MRPALDVLSDKIERISYDNLYEAVSRLKDAMQEMLVHIDRALPEDRENDQ